MDNKPNPRFEALEFPRFGENEDLNRVGSVTRRAYADFLNTLDPNYFIEDPLLRGKVSVKRSLTNMERKVLAGYLANMFAFPVKYNQALTNPMVLFMAENAEKVAFQFMQQFHEGAELPIEDQLADFIVHSQDIIPKQSEKNVQDDSDMPDDDQNEDDGEDGDPDAI